METLARAGGGAADEADGPTFESYRKNGRESQAGRRIPCSG